VQNLKEFVAQFEGEPEQGSQDWLDARRMFIGGSEMAAVLGLNKYKQLAQFYKEKFGVTKFVGNFATRWGSMFEPITQDIFRELFLGEHREDFFEVGGIKSEKYPFLRYSPDGLAVSEIDGVLHIVLLEFKAPYSKYPTLDIESYYIPQIYSGMCMVPSATAGIFISNVYRKCTFDQLKFDNPGYDRTLHAGDASYYDDQETTPLAFGVILLVAASEEPLSKPLMDRINQLGKCGSTGVFDLGSSTDSGTIDFIAHSSEFVKVHLPAQIRPRIWDHANFLRSDEIHPVRTEMLTYDLEAQIQAWEEDGAVVALPWKMIRSTNKFCKKNDSYLDRYRDHLMNVWNNIVKYKTYDEFLGDATGRPPAPAATSTTRPARPSRSSRSSTILASASAAASGRSRSGIGLTI
jgi:hypothetical protein